MDQINRSLEKMTGSIDLEIDWRNRVLLIGGIMGALLGIVSAIFYIRAAEESSAEGEPPEAPRAGDAVRLGLSLLTIMRTITEWGRKEE